MATSTLLRLTGFQTPSNLYLFLATTVIFSLFCVLELRFLGWKGDEGVTGRRLQWGQGMGVLWNSPRGTGEIYSHDLKGGLMRVAQQVHLWCVIPAGILLPLQFMPIMRRKYMTLHKYSGRALFICLMIGNITAFKLAPGAFGGSIETQSFSALMGFANSFAMYKAWSGIRDLRIDVHRVWVIRTWTFACSILSLRVLMVPMIIGIMTFSKEKYHVPMSCAKIEYIYANPSYYSTHIPSSNMTHVWARYPTCAKLSAADAQDTWVAVTATMDETTPERAAALMGLVFGTAGWVGFFINVFGCEIYLARTRGEDERLKKVSAVRRRAAGLEGEDEKKDA
ncbi:hypothetical protein BJ875DRAFT_227373 [Amylocarpus encephaloides]|uniref:Uncharacterized protein n=1 Tax=Amylocarpus encephaloides TaxID=45428 RepID=A0A9P7YNF9_9HELO|nr:hypothetical protein BJ875DRAFT_227373 [Amylocarpus encephaloides]